MNNDKIKQRLDAAFEFITKIGAGYYCFHDTDIVGDGTVFEIEKRLEKIRSGNEKDAGADRC